MEKLRVGIILNNAQQTHIPVWMHTMLERIRQSYYAEICLIVRDVTPTTTLPKFKELYKNRHNLLYYSYRKFEKRFKHNGVDAFVPRPVQDFTTGCDVMETVMQRHKFSDYMSEADVQTIKDHKLDVVLFFGGRILKGEVLNVAKYGVWSYHHGDNMTFRGHPACAWEFLTGYPLTGSMLQVLTEQLDAGNVIYRSYAQTDPVSIEANMNKVYWKTLAFMPRMLERLYHQRELFFEKTEKPLSEHPLFYTNRLYTIPTNREVVSLLFQRYYKKVVNRIKRLGKRVDWVLYFKLSATEDPALCLYQFKHMLPPDGTFWADPHVVKKDDKYYIFIEEYRKASDKGCISVIEMDEKGHYAAPKVAIEQDCHMSYPGVFEYEGKYYMTPETVANNCVPLYESRNFPYEWEFRHNLIENKKAVDPTVFYHNNKWWLFTNIKEYEGAMTLDELHLFYSDSLDNANWTPHPLNPVISDASRARPGGRLFFQNGNLYRPSQVAAPQYGSGISINQVLTLTETDYKEVQVNVIHHNWGKDIRGTHTLAHAGKLTVVDTLLQR
jgi:folate-dependent phosphoribosylglycinamide formyltransferase PurN